MKLRHYLVPTLLLLVALLLIACGAPAAPPVAAPDQTTEVEGAPAPPASDETVATPEVVEDVNLPEKSWAEAPPMTIDPSKTYIATFKTEKGDIVVELFADKAPVTVNNLVFLANEGFYDNTTFHRVLEDFMAQGGDPTGTGSGGPGYEFEDEIDPNLTFDRPGLLAMANSGPGTNGSQFFITFAPVPWLDGRHTIFGEVIEGSEVLDQLTRRDPTQNPDTPGDKLLTVEISEADASRLPTPTPLPTPFAPDPATDDHFMAAMPPAERVNYWNTPPENDLQPGQVYIATFKTEVGDITVELLTEVAPNNVNNFITLANAGYYDGTHFNEVIEDIVAVGGDPVGDGSGSPGYVINDELVDNAFDAAGWLGSAQPAPDSNTGQFFFTLGDTSWLTERFTPLGRVIEGSDVLGKIELRDPTQAPESPGTLLQRVDISTASVSQLPDPTPTPEPFSPTTPSDGERPLSETDPADRDGYYNTAPQLEIDTDKDYVAILRTDSGDITIDLTEKQTPNTVNNFVLLALNGFYDNTTFYRVIDGIVAQAGDPTGTGAGGPGYKFDDELTPELRHDKAGIVSMFNFGPGTNGSQFFITFDASPDLDEQYTIFGEVTEGMDVIESIPVRDPATATEPGLKIIRIDIDTK